MPDRKTSKIDKLLTPSWLSGLVAIAGGLAVTVGVVLAFSFNNSQVQQQLSGLQNTTTPTLTVPGQNPPESTKNSLQDTWPLLGFWAVVGLVIYFVVETGIQLIHDAEELRQELDYVHIRRDKLIKTTVEYLLIRLLAVFAWLFFIDIFFKRIIPYSITAAHASVSDLKDWHNYLYAVLSFIMIVASLHLHAIFLRLSLRRTRVFSAD